MPRPAKRTDRLGIRACAVGAGLALILFCNPAIGAVRHSVVYCHRDRLGLTIFAAKSRPDGKLLFGISMWEPTNNITVYGVADRLGDHWEYRSDMNAANAADRCRIDILFLPDGRPHLAADPNANCEHQGGNGTEIGSVDFSKTAYEGPVTFELRNMPTFFNRAGRCGRKKLNGT